MIRKLMPALLAVFVAATVMAPASHGSLADAGKRHSTKASTKIGFTSPSVVDPIHNYGEPDIRTSPTNSNIVHASGPWGTGTQRSIWNRSIDGGKTFVGVHQVPITSSGQSATEIAGPGGGDTELSTDSKGRFYYSDLAALASLKNALFDETKCHPRCDSSAMTTGVIANPQQNLNGIDRQWFATWDPPDPATVRQTTGYTGPFPVNYLVYLEALAGSGCSSTCEDATYSTDGSTYSAPTVTAAIGLDGNTVIDQTTGTVLEAVGVTGTSDVGVAKYTRNPANKADPALTKVDITPITTLPNGANERALFPVIAIDNNRTAYITWVTRNTKTTSQDKTAWQIYYSYAKASTDWTKWSKPVQVSRPPAVTNAMPWITAGAKGRVAISYYGTDDGKDNPSTTDTHQAWNVYLANLTNADTSNPNEQQIKVSPHPMHYGTICFEGTGCITIQGNRNLADFFQVEMVPKTGAIEVVYNDTSNDITQSIQNGASVPDSAADHKGAPQVNLVIQNRGIGLLGKPVTGPATSGRSIPDVAKDAVWDPLYGTTDVPSLDLRGVKLIRHRKKAWFKVKVGALDDTQGGLTATGSQALDYVVRWSAPLGKGVDQIFPIYYAAAEATATGTTFFAGTTQSVDLCSVSGCTPHALAYPAPPLGGTTEKGKVVVTKGAKPDYLVIKVPMADVGLSDGTLLQSLSVFALASPRQANQPPSNDEAENDIFPVEVDGICCRQAKMPRLRQK
ncbi:MAG: hypothetical protein QOC87_2110 [Actinomycetota bacterium]|jgi:hypothetical protein|nr:hypothetical protein [Actinomycetota bacterium]